MFVSSTLSVSQKQKLDCQDIAIKMSKAGIITSITSNISTQPEIEYGCRLTQSISSKKDIEKIWKILQNNYTFKCAHIKIDNIFDGCILDFLSPSKCNTKD